MAIESDADRAVMLADDGVTLAKVGESDITVLLDKKYTDESQVGGYAPVARARSSDVTASSLAKNDTVTVDSLSYTVAYLKNDGDGWTDVVLEAV